MSIDYLIKFLADDLMLFIIVGAAIALVIGVRNKDRYSRYTRIILAGLTALLIAKLMATIYQPTVSRPFEVMGQAPGASYLDNPGFPSDHTLLAMSIFYAIWFAVKRRWVVIAFGLAAGLVFLGRVLALVHTPLDIVGGVVAASIGALWYLNGEEKLFSRKSRRLQKH